MASDSANNWDAKFIDAGVPAGRVMSVPEILAHPHLVSREFVHEFNGNDAATRQRVTRAGFRFADADTALDIARARVLSANTREHLSTYSVSTPRKSTNYAQKE